MQKILIALIGVTLAACVVEPARTTTPPPTVTPVEGAPPPEPRPEPPPPGAHGAVLTGVIRNAVTHEPIRAASLDITSPALGDRKLTVQTGADGRFTTEPVPAGEFAIRVRRDGFEMMERKMVVGAGEAHVDIEMRPNH